MSEAPDAEAPETWAIVEILGHVRWAGRVREATCFGAAGVAIEIPVDGPGAGETTFVERFYAGASIYGVTRVPEAYARRIAATLSDPRPYAPSSPPQLGYRGKDFDYPAGDEG